MKNSFYIDLQRFMLIPTKFPLTRKKRLTFQVKWGWMHYRDRSTISSGAEEIQGNNKYDLQFQIRLKW